MEELLRLLQGLQNLQDGRYVAIYINGIQYMIRNIEGHIEFIANGKTVFAF